MSELRVYGFFMLGAEVQLNIDVVISFDTISIPLMSLSKNWNLQYFFTGIKFKNNILTLLII